MLVGDWVSESGATMDARGAGLSWMQRRARDEWKPPSKPFFTGLPTNIFELTEQ